MKILFQGDSITDCSRGTGLGQGYPLLVSARLGLDAPGQHEFFNFGISGNRVVDVYARIKKDCWNYAPDVLSLLIGVNDVWHEIGGQNGVEADRFYTVLKMLADDTLARFPEIRMIFMEPFVLNTGVVAENWDYFREETALRADAVRRVADECGAFFLPLQKAFDDACAVCDASYWLRDGVHPTAAGHQMIADRWLALYREKIGG
ncbi:MAG: SGNH/GDSL hydrolase family protein [Clostridia bacterium]|nr:SGNH/GDSL hydrolase family protein [Clostridia bacterium]